MAADRTTSAVAGAPPVLHVGGRLRDALSLDVLATLTTDDIVQFVGGRRWFAAKAGAPRAARIASVIPLTWDDGSFAIARLDVETASGAHQAYQLPLVVRARATPDAVLAHVESTEGEGLLFDAVDDAAFRRHLADAFAHGARFEGGASAWVIEPIGKRTIVVPLEAPIELGTAQQSNTSIRFAEEAILKLIRRVEPGEHPDVEIGRFLTTRAQFPYTPALFGIALFEDRNAQTGKADKTVAGMLQELLPSSVDVWTYVVEGGGSRVEGGASAPDYDDASPPSTLNGPHFSEDARRLGEVTRALHDALASAGPDEPDFVPEPVRAADVDEWTRATEAQVRDALDLLADQLEAGSIPAKYTEEARALVVQRGEFLRRVNQIAEHVRSDAGLRIRHHGDYHLGQVLRTAGGEFMIIDFEGEPSKSLTERRRKHSALRDVAGMLRSFAYAGAMISAGGKRGEGSESEEWERDARVAFLAGYLEGPQAAFLPKERAHIHDLISLFEMEKVFYELAYELNNRPDWIWIPMRGLREDK
jgi:trehalose synthase-fused probable maltokinase